MSSIDLSSLPVAPEFVSALQEIAVDTATDALKVLGVPENIIQLVFHINDLGYYLQECYRDPEALLNTNPLQRYDIEAITIEAINDIVKSGGTFTGAYTCSIPRPFRPRRLRRVQKQAEQMA